MTNEKLSRLLVARPSSRIFVALLAILTILFTGRSIWLQLPSALSPGGGTARFTNVDRPLPPSFDMSNATIPVERIKRGGPPKDGIPSITGPEMVSAAGEADRLGAREPVMVLALDGTAPRAYPLRYLMWHEVVNDEAAGVPFAVTFCPLCNSGLIFDRRLDGRLGGARRAGDVAGRVQRLLCRVSGPDRLPGVYGGRYL